MSIEDVEAKVQEIARRCGVKIKVVRLRKGDANCHYPGCFRVRPVGRAYCSEEHRVLPVKGDAT